MTRPASLMRRAVLTGSLAVLLAACSSAEKPKPTPLEAYTPSLGARVLWRTSIGSSTEGLRLALAGATVVAAGRDGTVVAVDAASGTLRWKQSVGAALSAGVGSDGRSAAVVTRDNELVLIDGGRELWRSRLKTAVVTPPLLAGERVFVQGVDRSVEAFDAVDGRRLWALARTGDPLTLSHPGVLATYKDNLLVGSGARLLSLDPLLGKVRGDLVLASPRGTNEVERLADLVGPLGRQGDVVCARAFQSAVGCTNQDRQSVLWSRVVSGYQGVAVEGELVVAGDATDRIHAWRRASGDIVWSSDRLRHRELSMPVLLPGALVVGDREGQVHFLSRDKGETRARVETDGSAVVGLARAGDQVVVLTRSGTLMSLQAN